VQHSRFVAQGAQIIAARLPRLDAGAAYILGLLHDIGRREGVTEMRHALDGYRFLASLGYTDAARVCLTHSFPIPFAGAGAGQWDAPSQEVAFVQDFLDRNPPDEYDRLIQLCDSLALPSGFCLVEKRLIDVALRYGFNEYTLSKWKAILAIRQTFEAEIGGSIYELLPDVVKHTFA
jgi:HD-like signal output (HDOD) protein